MLEKAPQASAKRFSEAVVSESPNHFHLQRSWSLQRSGFVGQVLSACPCFSVVEAPKRLYRLGSMLVLSRCGSRVGPRRGKRKTWHVKRVYGGRFCQQKGQRLEVLSQQLLHDYERRKLSTQSVTDAAAMLILGDCRECHIRRDGAACHGTVDDCSAIEPSASCRSRCGRDQ